LNEQGATVNQNNIVKSIEEKAAQLAEDPAQADTVKKLKSIVDNIISTGKDEVSAAAAETTKRNFNAGSKAWLNPGSDTATTEANKIAYRAYMQEVENTANKFNIDLGNTFKEAKQTFGLMKPIEEAAAKRATQLNQSPIGGLLDTTAAIGGTMAGGPMAGIAATVARRAIAPRIASSAAVSLDVISKALSDVPQYAALAKNNPQAFTALADSVYQSFKNEPQVQDNSKPPVPVPRNAEKQEPNGANFKWIDNGIKKIGQVGVDLSQVKNDPEIAKLLLRANELPENSPKLKDVIEQIRNTEAFKKAPKGGPQTSNKYPMSLEKNGHEVTVSNDKDYYEAKSEGWA
jgi:hypothetical protein